MIVSVHLTKGRANAEASRLAMLCERPFVAYTTSRFLAVWVVREERTR